MSKGTEPLLRVLLAEDHTIVRQGLCALLAGQPGIEVAGEAVNGRDALDACARLQPDVVVMDLLMPILNGVEATREIVQRWPKIKVIILSMHSSEEHVRPALRAGASGYLLKSLDSNEFLAMLEGVQRGESAMQRQTMSRLLDSLSDFSREPVVELTLRELELLRWVAQGYSNKAIAHEMAISPNTVKYHMKSVLQKLGVQNRTEAVMHAVRAGLVKPDPLA